MEPLTQHGVSESFLGLLFLIVVLVLIPQLQGVIQTHSLRSRVARGFAYFTKHPQETSGFDL